MKENQRVRYSVAFSVTGDNLAAVVSELGARLTAAYGGVTFLNREQGCVGFWAKNGNEHAERYAEPVLEERIVYFQLSVMPAQADAALRVIQDEVKSVALQFQTQTEYVHIESQPVFSHHTNITTL